MCLAIPMRLAQRGEFAGTAELDGVRREVSLMLVPEARAGEWVLVHAGYAIGVVDPEQAEETLALLRQAAGEELVR